MADTSDVRAVRVVVLASGSGSNLQALLDAPDLGGGTVVAVVSDRPQARCLERAQAAGVAAVALAAQPGESREAYDTRLLAELDRFQPDMVVMAGWMRLLSDVVVRRRYVINLHPALPGELPGIRAIERAFEQFTAGTRHRSGAMVHVVDDEGVDSGPVLATTEVPLLPGDDLTTFSTRMHAAEHRLLVHTVAAECRRLGTKGHPSP